MNTSIVKIFLSIACNVFLMTNNLLVNGYNCIYLTSNQFRTVHCKNSEFEDVPQDLDAKIEEIIFENDTFKEMSEKSLSMYKNLAVITIKNVAYGNRENPIHRKIFQELNRLRLLAIENIFTEFEPTFVYPPSLTELSLSRNDFIEEVDLSSAFSLTDFNAFSCSLRAFPRFNKSAPIATIDVRWNPMDNWTAEDLAPFCLLRSIDVQWDKKAKLIKPDRFCQCVRLETWIKKFNISTLHPLNCTPPENVNETHCSTEYSDEVMRQREECLNRQPKPVDDYWRLLMGATMLTIPATTLGYLSIKTRMALRTSNTLQNIETETHTQKKKSSGKKSTTKPPEKSERGGEAETETDTEKEQPLAEEDTVVDDVEDDLEVEEDEEI